MRSPRAVAAVFRSWVCRPLEAWPRAVSGDAEGVRELRAAIRRLRLLAPILVRKPDSGAMRRLVTQLRKVARQAGPCRDLEVVARLLLSPPRLEESRLQQLAALAEALSRNHAAVQRLSAALAGKETEALFVVLWRWQRTRDELVREIGQGLETAHIFDPEALHWLRIRVRRLRYLSGLLGQIKDARSPGRKPLRRLQNGLGEVQDACVVAKWLAGERAHAEAEVWKARAEEAHARFLDLDPWAIATDAFSSLGAIHFPPRRGAQSMEPSRSDWSPAIKRSKSTA
jgi:CHAD domain-containing protein